MTPTPHGTRHLASPRPVLWLALALAAALALLDGLAEAHGSRPLRGWAAIAELLLAGTACLAAGWTFGRGDHLRRAWVLLAVSHLALACLYLGDVLLVPDASIPSWYLPAFTVLANVARLAGTGLFAVAWLRTGLPAPGTRLGRLLTGGLLLAGSALVVGPDLAHYAGKALRGDAYSGILALADLSDVAVLLMLVPLVQTARALAGGSLAWPFGLMAAANLAWLLFDGLDLYAGQLGLPPLAAKAGSGALQALGCLLFAAAAVTQRRAMRCAARGAARA